MSRLVVLGWKGGAASSQQGALLCEVLLRRGQHLGFGQIRIWTTPNNQRAIDSYERIGFEQSDTVPKDVGSSEKFVSLVRPPLAGSICLGVLRVDGG